MKRLFIVALITLTVSGSFAQTKVGTIQVEFIISNMTTDLQKVNDSLNAYGDKLANDITPKMDEYEALYAEFEKTAETMTDEARQIKAQEITVLENDILKFRQNGQQLIQIREDELMAPLYRQVGVALDAEAKANGYTQVLSVGSNSLAYYDPNYDLTDAVMKRMGVTVKERNTDQGN